jgi:TPR repeat protein
VVAPPASADYQSGLNAYNRGDYATAMREWREVTDGPATASSPGEYVESFYAVAMLYWQGQGVPRDFYKAYEWLLKAANMNHAGAQAKLGYLYTDGIAVPQNHDKAFEWYRKAAGQGNVDGLYNLGICYLYGWGAEPDKDKAKHYLAAAAAQGDEAAEAALEQLIGSEENPIAGEPAPTGQEPIPVVTPDPVGASLPATAPAPIHGPDWILARDPNHYTLQVIALSNRKKLEDLLAGHNELAPLSIYQATGSKGTLHVLIQGDYPTLEAVRAARDAFPREVQQRDQLWIRKFIGVQKQVSG